MSPPPAPLRLLGAPQLEADGRRVPFSAERPFLLLALLACRREWVRRDELADLLYPGRDLEPARSNLRKVLFLARRIEGVGPVEQRGDLLRWAPDSDLQRFERACDEKRHADAIAAYGGPLLLGLDGAWPAGAADWLDAERQRLQSRWHEACTRRLDELQDQPEAARELAQRMLRHDPLDDRALQALGRAGQALGRRDEALAAVTDYARRLSAELQMQPSAAVQRLAEELRGSAPLAPAPAGPPLIGRRHELAQARARLDDPGCRVLTLLGPPGAGKSALARTLAAERGATWLALDGIDAVDELAHRMALALGLAPDGALPAWTALARALGPRTALVALDGCEQLPLAATLQSLLAACPGLRLLAASRTAFGIDGEWRLPVEGLPLPDADERDAEVLRANDAVRLFEQRALPLAPAFELAAEAADVVALLHEVDGLPLAIELLAAWRRLMPVREIRAELAASLDLLEPSGAGERSVRASFGRSWQQLGPAEQRVLAQMALLPGPCSRELLRNVLQAPLPVLAALVDRSLLRAGDDGLLALHPLLRRCAAPLASDAGAVRERHARHVAQRFGHEAADIGEQLAHLQAAWHWGVEQRDAAVLGALVRPYQRHLLARARWRDGLRDLGAAARALAPTETEGAARATMEVLGLLLTGNAVFHYALGELDAAKSESERALALAARFALPAVAAQAHQRLGGVAWQRGHYVDARTSFLAHQQAAREAGDDAEAERSQAWLALVEKALGHYDAALALYAERVTALRAQGLLAQHLYVLNNLGNLLRLLGRTDEARATLLEGLALARAHQELHEEPFLLTNLALVHETAGDRIAAADWAHRAVASAQRDGEPMIEAAARLARARVGSGAAAWADVAAALAIARRLQGRPLRVQCLGSAGVVLARDGAPARGVAIVAWAMAQPETTRSEREDAQRHLDRIAPGVAAEPLPDAMAPEDVLALLPAAGRA